MKKYILEVTERNFTEFQTNNKNNPLIAIYLGSITSLTINAVSSHVWGNILAIIALSQILNIKKVGGLETNHKCMYNRNVFKLPIFCIDF